MELIIKPTEACNFKCTFCSSTHLVDDKSARLEIEKIAKFLDRFPETSTIIVNGGDPLMMPPGYYLSILQEIEKRDLQTTLSLTTNLWGFYKNPDLWTDLFRHPLVGVCTSFNYGNTRKITETKVYTEEIFFKVSDLFLERVGYRPDFISVITEENLDTAIDNVLLAKKMNVECKLNYAVASGELSIPLLKGKIYKVYLDIIDLGLARWEYNSKQLLSIQNKKSTSCPLNRECDSSIRCLQPKGDYYSCGAFGDDNLYPVDFNDEVVNDGEIQKPLLADAELSFLKESCLTCPLFNICNGCRKTISDLKRNNLVEDHCLEMQKNLPRLLQYLQ
jgi:radical SAM protein with 4Fe4S-binding SPASM domain